MDQMICDDPDLSLMEIESRKGSKNPGFRSAFESMKHRSGGLKGPLEGVTYQQALINTVAVTCYSEFQNDFNIFCEDQAFAKFDDLVLELQDCILFHQAKHNKAKIPYTVNDFTSNPYQRNVNLVDYFGSYMNIKKKFGGEKKLFFIFFFNSGFSQELFNCTKLSTFDSDDIIFQDFKGETRTFDFEKNEKSQETKKEFIKALGPVIAMEIQKRKTRVEIELPDIHHDKDITEFIKTLSEILEKTSSSSPKPLMMAKFKARSKPLFLSILNWKTEEVEKKFMEKTEEGKEEREKETINLNFTEDFILNNNLVGISKKIRSELVFKKGEDCLKTLLKNTLIKCPDNLFELETVPDPKDKSSLTESFSFSQVNEENEPKITCCFGSKKDQFLLMSLFRNEKESGPLAFEDSEFKLHFKTEIYNSFLNIFNKRVTPNLKQNYDPKNQEYLKLIDEFLGDLYFKINQPSYEELHKLSHEKMKGLTELGSREIHERIFLLLGDWLVSPASTRLKGYEFHAHIQESKNNLKRYELFRDSEPFTENCKQKLLFLNSFHLDVKDPLKKFLEESDSYIFVVSEEGIGSSQLYSFQAISQILGIQKDTWAYIDIKVDHFKFLSSYLQSADLQYIIIDISIELGGEKDELLKEVLVGASREQKKVILLNAHAQRKIQNQNLKLIWDMTQGEFSQCIAKELTTKQIETACQGSQEKYLLVGGKYRQLRDILADPNCGLYKAMSHPEYLYEILKNCEDRNEYRIDSEPLYIQNEIVHSVPLYSLKMLLMQTTAKIIWLQNSPNNIFDLLEKWFPNQTSTDKKKKKIKIGPYFIMKNINSFLKYLELPTCKGRVIIIGYISSMVYQKIKRKILSVYCPDNDGTKKSSKRYENESLSTFKVEIVEKSDFMKLIKPISFTETSQVGRVQTMTRDNLLECSSRSKRGNINWISADAGMGKTYLLNELKRRWQNLQANSTYDWVYLVDLTKINESNITTLEDFLVDISPEFDRKHVWLRTTLEHDKNSGRILLLFDAWDEVKPAMQDRVKMLIEKIPSNMNWIIVTRPYGLNSIDLSRWNHNYFTLQPFDEKLTNEYIHRFFSEEKFSEDFLKNLSRKIFEWMKNLRRNFSQVLGIPLQISQLCQVFFSKLQKEPDLDISEWFDENKPLNIVRLYDQFIETVFHKLCFIDSENLKILYDFWQNYFYFLSKQAYQQLFDKSIDESRYQDQLSEDSKKQLLKTGLVKSIDEKDGTIEFAHQTYKEYFGAFYLLRILCEEEEQSKRYTEVVQNMNDKKYQEFYQMVFIFAFQISFHGHPLLPQNRKEYLAKEFWKILHRDPKDVLGRASNKLFSACLSPLANEQKEEFFSWIPEMYHPKEILSRKERNIWVPTSMWTKKSLTEEVNEEFGDKEIISSLRDKSNVLRFTKEVIQKRPNCKKQLAECFKKVCLIEDLDWFWDINGGFQAMALLGDDFDSDHSKFFKKRIMIDPSRRIEPAVSALIILGRISSKNEVIKEISSILLMIFGRFGARFSHILDVVVQNIHPSRLIYALMNLIGVTDEFEDPLSLIFSIAYIAEYAVIISQEEVLFDTGKKRFAFSRDRLPNDQNEFIEEIQEDFNPSTCSYRYFLKRRLRVQDMSRRLFCSMSTKEKRSIVYNGFLDGKEANETATWLRENRLLEKDFANILEEIVASHKWRFDNWARDGGWCAITKMGKYFNKRFGEFLILRGQLWPKNIPEIEKEFLKLEKDLNDSGKENYNDNEVNVAQKYLKELREELSRRKYFLEKSPLQKNQLSRTATF